MTLIAMATRYVLPAAMLSVIQIWVKINVAAKAIVVSRLRKRLTAVTALTRTVTPIQTAKMKTALMIRLVFVK